MRTEQGRSMIEMLGVLAVIGILTLASFAGYQKAIEKSRVNKTVEKVALTLQNYADLTLKDTTGLDITGADAVEKASSLGLIDGCVKLESEADEGYQICEVPLGELYVKFQDMGDERHSYMMSLMMIDKDENACIAFLTQGWGQIIPKEWWPNAMIWLMSDAGETVVYPQGDADVTAGQIGSACRNLCTKDNVHCMVVFDIAS